MIPMNLEEGPRGVYANLVIGKDGSTIFNGNSQKLSTRADRRRFHEIREHADVIIIGRNTAEKEPYSRTPKPLIILSRTLPEFAKNPEAIIWNKPLRDVVTDARELFGPRILLESGTRLLTSFVDEDLLDGIYLTISPITGGEQRIDWRSLFKDFTIEESSEHGEEKFLFLVRQA
jgi:riboflavin biosynthesis pyrimidine reductase